MYLTRTNYFEHMDIKELKNKSASELHKALAEKREKLRELRFKDAAKQLKNIREVRVMRKEISRVLTLLNQKRNSESDQKDIKVIN